MTYFLNSPRSIEHVIIDFIISMKNDGEGYFATHNYLCSIISFYKINDIVLNTNKISKFYSGAKDWEERQGLQPLRGSLVIRNSR
jgi:hypothetical protein